MSYALDLNLLAGNLRKTRERPVMVRLLDKVNPYLLNVILPALERKEYPLLWEIDFDQFDTVDTGGLVNYIQEKENLSYQARHLVEPLCRVSPACTNKRAFL